MSLNDLWALPSPSAGALFYVAPDLAMMAVSISTAGPDIQMGKPVRLFQSRALQGNVEYDVPGTAVSL
jgi:hypothetical protein